MEDGKLFVFSAPSGSGKTTLVHHLLQQNLPLGFSISATSRAPRGEEKQGKDYYFLSEEDFRKKLKKMPLSNTKRFIKVPYTGLYVQRLIDCGLQASTFFLI